MTLYLTEQYALVRLDEETLVVVVRANPKLGIAGKKTRIPLIKISRVVVMGNITLTTGVIAALAARRIAVVYLTRFGKFVARVNGDTHKHGQLRLLQSRAHDDPTASLHIAVRCVRAKLHNQRTLLLRSSRNTGSDRVRAAAEEIGVLIRQVDALPTQADAPPNPRRPQQGTIYGQLMGYEGAAAAAYFGAFGQMLDPQWGQRFTGRVKRPPTDPVNALLSFGYTLLTQQVTAAAQIVGLDPQVGFFHTTQYGRPALALDVVEMFRAPIVDSVVLTVLNNRMLGAHDFEETLGAWRLTDEGRRTFLQRFEERMTGEIIHPVFKTKVTYRRCLELQMRLLSRWLLGELKRYREFTVR